MYMSEYINLEKLSLDLLLESQRVESSYLGTLLVVLEVNISINTIWCALVSHCRHKWK